MFGYMMKAIKGENWKTSIFIYSKIIFPLEDIYLKLFYLKVSIQSFKQKKELIV